MYCKFTKLLSKPIQESQFIKEKKKKQEIKEKKEKNIYL